MRTIVLIAVFGIASMSRAEGEDVVKFPIDLLPGDPFRVKAQYLTPDGPLKVTKLSVLPEEDLRDLTKIALEGQVDRQLVSVLEKKAHILEQLRTELQTVADLNREGYDRYRKLWLESDKLLEKEEIRSEQRFRKGFTVGAGVTAVGILVVKLILN